jgi:5-methylcytosine-specific restriction endonuclease McrA
MDRKEYLRNYQRQWVANRRQEYFKDKVCTQCGSSDKLELHHINPEDKVDHSIWSWSKERQALELVKCTVLCKDCHQKADNEVLGYKNYIHGTRLCYNKGGCRCLLCKKANAAYRAEYRTRVGHR